MTHRLFHQRMACAFLTFLCALGDIGCATIGDEYFATPVDAQGKLAAHHEMPSGLVISGEERTEYASQYFGLLEVTFENKSGDWVRVERLSLDFGSQEKNQAVALPWGSDIDAWYSATVQRNNIRDTNEATALAALLAVSETVAVVGATTGERRAAAAGGLVALGSTAALVAKAQDERIQVAERAQPFPESHLLALPFAVPPGLFAKKWILLSTRERTAPCIRTMLLDYDVAGKGRERGLLPFRGEYERSEWQRESCSQWRKALARTPT